MPASVEDGGSRGGKDGFGSRDQKEAKCWTTLHENTGLTLLVGPATGWLQTSLYQKLVRGDAITLRTGAATPGKKWTFLGRFVKDTARDRVRPNGFFARVHQLRALPASSSHIDGGAIRAAVVRREKSVSTCADVDGEGAKSAEGPRWNRLRLFVYGLWLEADRARAAKSGPGGWEDYLRSTSLPSTSSSSSSSARSSASSTSSSSSVSSSSTASSSASSASSRSSSSASSSSTASSTALQTHPSIPFSVAQFLTAATKTNSSSPGMFSDSRIWFVYRRFYRAFVSRPDAIGAVPLLWVLHCATRTDFALTGPPITRADPGFVSRVATWSLGSKAGIEHVIGSLTTMREVVFEPDAAIKTSRAASEHPAKLATNLIRHECSHDLVAMSNLVDAICAALLRDEFVTALAEASRQLTTTDNTWDAASIMLAPFGVVIASNSPAKGFSTVLKTGLSTVAAELAAHVVTFRPFLIHHTARDLLTALAPTHLTCDFNGGGGDGAPYEGLSYDESTGFIGCAQDTLDCLRTEISGPSPDLTARLLQGVPEHTEAPGRLKLTKMIAVILAFLPTLLSELGLTWGDIGLPRSSLYTMVGYAFLEESHCRLWSLLKVLRLSIDIETGAWRRETDEDGDDNDDEEEEGGGASSRGKDAKKPSSTDVKNATARARAADMAAERTWDNRTSSFSSTVPMPLRQPYFACVAQLTQASNKWSVEWKGFEGSGELSIKRIRRGNNSPLFLPLSAPAGGNLVSNAPRNPPPASDVCAMCLDGLECTHVDDGKHPALLCAGPPPVHGTPSLPPCLARAHPLCAGVFRASGEEGGLATEDEQRCPACRQSGDPGKWGWVECADATCCRGICTACLMRRPGITEIEASADATEWLCGGGLCVRKAGGGGGGAVFRCRSCAHYDADGVLDTFCDEWDDEEADPGGRRRQ